MSPETIKQELKLKHYDQPKLASELDKSQTAIHLVIWRKSTSLKIMKYIAGIIGKPFDEVWEVEEDSINPKGKV